MTAREWWFLGNRYWILRDNLVTWDELPGEAGEWIRSREQEPVVARVLELEEEIRRRDEADHRLRVAHYRREESGGTL